MRILGARVRRAAGVVLTVLASTRTASAAAPGPGHWTPIGPPGGSVLSVAAAGDGQTIYAGCGNGVYKSVNRGRTWQIAGQGLVSEALAVRSPRSAPATAYAHTPFGLFATFDAARHWTRIDANVQPFPDQVSRILGFGVSDSAPAVVYLAVITPLSFLVYGSSDAGASWHAGSGLPANGGSFDFAVDPSHPQVAYLGLGNGAFRTADGGRHWSRAGLYGLDVLLLTLDRVQPKHLYAYVGSVSRPRVAPRIYTSADGGASWVARHDNLGGVALGGLVADPFQAATLYSFEAPRQGLPGRIFKTTDGGTSWRAVEGAGLEQPPTVQGLAVDPVRPGVLYLALDVSDRSFATGLYQSADGGKSWIPSASGIQTQEVTGLALDPQKAGVVYATLGGLYIAAPGGLVKTVDGGKSWTGTGFDGQVVNAVVTDLDSPATLYAAPGSVYRSVDAGGHWDPLPGTDLGGAGVLAVAGGIPWGLFGPFVARWNAATASWIIVAGTSFGQTFAAVLDGGGTTVYFDNSDAIDSGGEPIYSGQEGSSFPVALEVPGQSTAIVIDPKNPQEVVVTYRQDSNVPRTGGIFLSSDRGSQWKQPVVGSGGPLYGAAIDPFDPLHIAAGGAEGVFETHDGGDTWTGINDGLPPGGVFVLQFSRQMPPILYAATGGGAYVLTPQ